MKSMKWLELQLSSFYSEEDGGSDNNYNPDSDKKYEPSHLHSKLTSFKKND